MSTTRKIDLEIGKAATILGNQFGDDIAGGVAAEHAADLAADVEVAAPQVDGIRFDRKFAEVALLPPRHRARRSPRCAIPGPNRNPP
jgi:hypothetical protein